MGRRLQATQNTMVHKKKLIPTGPKNRHEEYRNVYLNLTEAEISVAGLDIDDEVFVRVQDGEIIVESPQ